MATRTVSVRLMADIGQYVSGMSTAAAATSRLGNSVTDSTRRAQSGFGIASKGAVLLGAAVVGGMALAVSKSIEFEKAMSAAAAATMASGAALGDLRDAAMEAGAATQYSATEAAQAITEMGKAGVSTADILDGGLNGALSLAAAGQLDVAKAAEIASVAMTQFKLSGDQLPHVADLLAAGAGKAMGSVEDLGMALNQAGLVAASTGVSIEETTGTLAAFASAGLIGSDAGTSFRSMLQHLQNPSKESAELMATLGINMYDAQGAFVGMEDLAGQLQTRLGGMTQATRDQAMAQIFGSDAVRAANVLYSEGADGIADWTKKVNDQGYAAEQAAKLTDNLAGDLERLGGAFDTLMISIGSGAQGPMRSMTQGLTDLIDGLAAALEAGKDLGSELAHRLAPFMYNVEYIAGALWDILSDLVDTVGPLAAGIAAIAASAIISGLTTLSEVLSAITGFLADNEAAAFALAAVLGVQLAGGITAVTVAFNRMILTPVVLFLSSVLGGAGAVATFLSGGFSAAVATARTALVGLLTAAAPLAAVAAVAYGVTQLIHFSEAAGEARAEVDDMWEAVEAGTSTAARMEALSSSAETLRDKVAGLRKELGELADFKGDFNPWIDAPKAGLGMGEGFEVEGQIEALREYEAALARVEEQEAETVSTMRILGNQFGLSRQQVIDLADKYGVDLTQGTQNAYMQFQRFYNTEYGKGPEDSTARLNGALEVMADKTSTAEERVDALKTALDILGGKQVSVFEATSALQQVVQSATGAMEGLSGEVLTADGHLNAYSESGQKAGDILIGVRDKGNDLITTMIEQGATIDEVRAKDAELRQSFIDSAIAMGIGEDAAIALANEILGVPSDRETRFAAAVDQALANIAVLQARVDAVARDRSATITIRANMPDLNGVVSGGGRMGSYASGGTPRAGEVALVGEKGPEIVRFGSAATVYTATETRAMLSGRESSSTVPSFRSREFSGGGGGGSVAIDYDRLAAAVSSRGPSVSIGNYNEARQSPHEIAEDFAFMARTRG